jgi:HK97 family phage portal protein
MRWIPFSRRGKATNPRSGLKSSVWLLGMGSPRGSLSNAGYEALANEGYAINAVANACINKLANSIASIDRKLYQKTKGGKLKEVEQHEVLDLLANPNPTQSGDEFTRALVSYYLIAGNAYLFGNGIYGSGTTISGKPKPPSELQLLIPGRVRVEPGAGLFPNHFEYKPKPDTQIIFPVDRVTGGSALLHLKTFNPVNQWVGLPPMIAAAYGIDIHNSGQRWNKKMLDNDCRPSGALIVKKSDGQPDVLTDDQYSRLKEMIDSQFSGADNAGRPMLLEGGLDWKEMSLNPKDIDWSKGKVNAALDVCMAFGVPPQLIGLPGSQTYANYEQATLSFWTETVLPLYDWIQDAYNRWLVPLYGEDLLLGYDKNSIHALEPLRKELFSRVQDAEFLTLNEKRRAVGHDDFGGEIGESLMLTGRGVLLNKDGSVVSLGISDSIPSTEDPLADDYQTSNPAAPQPNESDDPEAAEKHRRWLEKNGYTPEHAERLTKLVYG